MKKSILLVAALALVAGLFGASNASAMTYEQAALQVAVDAGCITTNDKSYCDVYVETTSICFASGYITTAHVYYNPVAHCQDNPSKPCPKPAVYLKADVVFSCDNTVETVTCY